MDAFYKLYCDFRDAHVAVHSSYCPLNLLPVHCQISINKFPFAVYADVCKGEKGVCPDADESGQGGGDVNFCYILQTSFMDDP